MTAGPDSIDNESEGAIGGSCGLSKVTDRSMEMKVLLVSVALLCPSTDPSREVTDGATVQAPRANKPARVGGIYIVGNDRTRMNVIQRQFGLFPGQVIDYSEICRAERRLARLNIFKTSPDGAVRPTITVVDGPGGPDDEYKDVIIKVVEDDTGVASLKSGVNSEGEWVMRVVVEERNFDPWRIPTSAEDLLSGRAFRGAGLAVGLDLQFKIPLRPVNAPSISLGFKLPFHGTL